MIFSQNFLVTFDGWTEVSFQSLECISRNGLVLMYALCSGEPLTGWSRVEPDQAKVNQGGWVGETQLCGGHEGDGSASCAHANGSKVSVRASLCEEGARVCHCVWLH